MKSWRAIAICVCGAVWAFCPLLLAKPGVVHTREGLTYDGDVTETDTTVTIRVRGIATTIARPNIASIDYAENLAADIEARWKKLPPTEERERIALGKQAFEAREYLLSRKILQEVLELDPNNRAASDLYDMARAQIDLENKHAAAAADPSTATTAPPQSTAASATPVAPVLTNDRRYVSLQDLNNIRQMEITSRDTNVRFRFDPDLARRFTIGTDINPAEFKARPAMDQFLAVRDNGRPDFLRSIRVQSDPQSIIEFKRDIQQPVLAGCAASNCHGAPAHPGYFQLLSEVGDPAVYTNFFNLATYEKTSPGQSGIFGKGVLGRMIDRAQPENSLLLQYMLPPEMAQTPHPLLKSVDYRGVVKGKDDPKYQRIASWIANTLAPTDPQYNVAYKPPFITPDPTPASVFADPATASGAPPITPSPAPAQPAAH